MIDACTNNQYDVAIMPQTTVRDLKQIVRINKINLLINSFLLRSNVNQESILINNIGILIEIILMRITYLALQHQE